MEKILLVGKLSEIVRSLNECLVDAYQVQLCPEQLENVQAMVRIAQPKLIIICHIAIDDIGNEVFEWIQKKCPQIPVLGITTIEIWREFRELYKDGQFTVLFRPVTRQQLQDRCRQILYPDGAALAERKTIDSEQQKKIMIVDDSALLLRRMKSMLEKHYHVCLAKSGEQALRMIPNEKPDLILLDYEMDGMNGKDVFEAIKEDENAQSIPIVFLTSVAKQDPIYSVLKLKPDGYILKPPEEKRILETIKKIIYGF